MEILESHIFKCWRLGYKSKKISEEYHQDISEKDINDKFKYVVEKYFKEIQ